METDHSDHAFLIELGSRSRSFREQASMTRKALSDKSGLSERYLAQLEAGQGNLSILLLRRLASALDKPLEAFISESADSTAMASVVDILRPLNTAALLEAGQMLGNRFLSSSNARAKRVALVGLRGAGKTTLGQLLARRTARNFLELDAEIERDMGASLSNIFAVFGQEAYRSAQRRVLQKLIDKGPSFVLSTGGSLVEDKELYQFLREHCYTIWLKAEPEDHFHRVIDQGDLRPIKGRRGAMEELRNLLKVRESSYGLADLTVDTSRLSKDQACARMLQAIKPG